ncbi:MAG: ATP-binding protein [Bacteroidales bacterium]|nr:ATP-binding protein [Bacteroidales bacterium]
MDYEIGKNYDFDVIKEFGDDEPFFRLSIPEYGEYRLPKLKFQRNEPLPDRLTCSVKRYDNTGKPIPSHFPAQYVNRFYQQGFTNNREFEFTVIELPSGGFDYVKLEDKYGIQYRLRDDGSLLSPGQKIKCRFSKLSKNSFDLECSNDDMRLPLYSPADFFEKVGVPLPMRHILEDGLRMMPAMADAAVELEHDNPLWVVTALQSVSNNLSEWFVTTDTKRHYLFFNTLIDVLRRSALYLIENSRFLRNLAESQRRILQKRLTGYVEGLEPYRRTLEILDTSNEVRFVEDLMEKLRQSGYLYHPARQFSILMLIMRTSPELVNKYLGSIFDTIMEWKLETWSTEPFRSAFVDQFEIYIRHASAEIDLLPQADTPEDNDRLEKIVIAIALQLLISGDLESEQARRNRALFYRCISLLRPVVSDDLLDKAYLTLMGKRLPIGFGYDDIKQPLMLMTRALVPATEQQRSIENVYTHVSGDVCVTVDDSGISLRRTDEAEAPRLLPTGMIEWPLLSPQIYLGDVKQLSKSNLNNMDAHRRLWSDIEKALFERSTAKGIEPAELYTADIDEMVWVIIDPLEVSGGDDPEWRCRIDDPEYESGTGYLRRSEIVNYNIKGDMIERNRQLVQTAFVDNDGTPRRFKARVIGIDEDGEYEFSLRDTVAEKAGDILNYNDTYTAVITSVNGHDSYSCVTETGYGMFLDYDKEFNYKRSDYVRVRLLDMSDPHHMHGTISSFAGPGTATDFVAAFTSLMRSISTKAAETDDMDDMTIFDDEAPLSRESIYEIISIMRFKAISSRSLLDAYDCLLFARLLALAIGDHSMASRLQTHASLLRLHQFYAKNRKVDADELEQFRPLVNGYPMLEIIFHRLEIVSWLGCAEHNADLWETINASRNNLENTLARMVLSYNMLPDDDIAENPIALGLKSRIAELLGVNFERTTLKNYGPEGQYVEFKTSIVYPPRRSKNDSVEPDPERQQFNLLRVIAGMLNSSGGKLYIGVNDKTHCEAGLFEDMQYYAKGHKATIGAKTYSIQNADNICNFLNILVRETWDANVLSLVDFAIDQEARHDVIVVTVKPRMTPTRLDGKLYVRRSSSTVQLTDEETAEFVAERRDLELMKRREVLAGETETDEATDTGEIPARNTATAEIMTDTAITEPAADNTIPTSQWRPNVLHSYEDGYLSPTGYLIFRDDDTLTYTVEDQYAENDRDCRLVLSFTADEQRGGYLIMVFGQQRVLKVPLQEIIEKGANRRNSYWHDLPLIFACIATSDSALLSILTDNKGNMFRRVTPMSDIEASHLTSNPDRITEVPGTNETLLSDIVAPEAVDSFEGSLRSKLGSRQIGYPLRCTMTEEKAKSAIDKTIATCTAH